MHSGLLHVHRSTSLAQPCITTSRLVTTSNRSNTRFDLGVNNVTNKQPPFLYANNTINANTDPFDFDLLGRYYWARMTVKF